MQLQNYFLESVGYVNEIALRGFTSIITLQYFLILDMEDILSRLFLMKHIFETSSVIFWQKSPPAKSSKIVKSCFMQNRKSFAGWANVCGEQLPSAISESKKRKFWK